MAKPKKKRNKAYDPERSLRAIVSQYVKKVYCYDGKCLPEMKFNDVVFRSDLPQMVKKRVMYAVGEEVLPWSIMLFSFEVDGVEVWYFDDLKPEASNKLNSLLDGELEKKIAGRNPNRVISWGWFAIPLKGADLEAMQPEILKIFEEAGAYDREHCEQMHQQRVMTERLEEMGKTG